MAPAFRARLLADGLRFNGSLTIFSASGMATSETEAIADRSPSLLGIDGPNPQLAPCRRRRLAGCSCARNHPRPWGWHGIDGINAASLRKEQQRLKGSQELFQNFLRRTVFLALSLGLLVALISTARVAVLERRNDQQRERAESAEEKLRRLSRNLVRTQEEERRSLSRELHDAVGQMLSAMTMELGNLESLIASPDELRARLDEARRLNAETIRGVRDLAVGLRPAMLDELG